MPAAVLTRRQIDEFFELGFVRLPPPFSTAEVAEMRGAFERLERTAYRLRTTRMYRGSRFVLDALPGGGTRIRRIVWCGAAEPVLSHYGRDPRLLRIAALLLGSREMHQLINQAHFKLPGDGVEFPWHQDSTHRRYGRPEWRDANGRGSYVQTVLALDDVTEDNGPLQLVPESCKLGHLAVSPEGRLPEGSVDSSKAVSATMPAGGLLLFGPYTLHRSRPNQSRGPRRVFINGFAYPGANSRIYPGEGAGRLLHFPR